MSACITSPGQMSSVILAVALFVAAASTSSADPPRFSARMLPAHPTQPSVYPTALNAGGVVIARAADDPYSPTAILLRSDGQSFSEIPVPPDSSMNFASDLDTAGRIVGIANGRPYLWDGDDTGYLLPPPGYFNGNAYGLNDGGVMVGSFVNDMFFLVHPVIWGGPHREAAFLPAFYDPPLGQAYAINAAGQIAGHATTPGGGRAVRWDDPNQPPLVIGMLPGAEGSEAVAINGLGDVAGRSSYADYTVRAMFYDSATASLVEIPSLGGSYSFAYAVNDAKEVVGTSNNGSDVRAFLWLGGVTHDLNALVAGGPQPFSALTAAVDINNAGQILADALLPDYSHRAVVLDRLRPGDMDCDGDVDFGDIDAFVLALGGETGYTAVYPGCLWLNGDCDVDNGVNFYDIDPFVGLLGTVYP